MFKISPIQSQDEQRQCAEACNTEYISGYFAYSMRDSKTGSLMGFSQFDISGEIGYISDIRCVPGLDDYEAMFILGRATMSFIDTCGVHRVRAAKDAGDAKLLCAIGFLPRDDEYYADMTGFFDGSCHNNK